MKTKFVGFSNKAPPLEEPLGGYLY